MANIAGLILPYNGNHATIPSLWTRVTGLDAKVLKAAGAVEAGVTGGADTHAHTGIQHTHARSDSHGHYVAYNYQNQAGDDIGGSNNNPHPEPYHTHDAATITTSPDGAAVSIIAYPSSVGNSLPPYHEVIFLKASSGASLQQNHLIFSDVNEVPTNWQIPDGTNGTPDMRNRYFRGAGTGQNAGVQGGSLIHIHVLNHSHTTSHTHYGNSGGATNMRDIQNGGSGSWKISQHNHMTHLNSASVVTDTYVGNSPNTTNEPEYYKLLGLINMGGGPLKKGMIGMWEDSIASIPAGLLLCDGRAWTDGIHHTPDLRNKYIKIANDGIEIGNTGGSNAHAHAASNSHTHTQTGGHSHTGYTDTVYHHATEDSTGGTRTPSEHAHSLASIGDNNATMTWGAATINAESVNNEPAYKTIYYVQFEKVGTGAAILLNLLESE